MTEFTTGRMGVVARVKQAICAVVPLGITPRDHTDAMARAAIKETIASMREPTEAVVYAGHGVAPNQFTASIWIAMLAEFEKGIEE